LSDKFTCQLPPTGKRIVFLINRQVDVSEAFIQTRLMTKEGEEDNYFEDEEEMLAKRGGLYTIQIIRRRSVMSYVQRHMWSLDLAYFAASQSLI
jgi:hypothetical protein